MTSMHSRRGQAAIWPQHTQRAFSWVRRLAGGGLLLAPVWWSHALETRDLFAFSAGPVVLKPFVTTAVTYSDNVYSLPSDSPLEDLGFIESVDDLFMMITPGLRARLGRADSDASVDFEYRFDQYLYLENKDSDASNHSFSLGAGVSGSRLSYSCSNSLRLLNSIMTGYEATVDGIIVPPGNVERQSVALNHNLDYALTTKSRARVGASYSLMEYSQGDRLIQRYVDTTTWRATGGYDYSVTERTRLGGLLSFGQYLSSSPDGQTRSSDSDAYGASITAAGQFTSRLSGDIRVGYEHRVFHLNENSDGYPTVGLSLTQAFTERTTLTAGYNRGGGVSSAGGQATVSDSFRLGFKQVIGSRRPWFVDASASYILSEYSSLSGQTFDNLRLGVGATYPIRLWASAFLRYSWEQSDRSAGYEYAVNQVIAGISLGL